MKTLRPTNLLAAVAVCTAVMACGGAPALAAPAQAPQQVSTTDYKVLASALYKERAGIENQMTTIAQEQASAATRVQQINGQLLPALNHLLGEAQAIQPVDAPAADLHQHLITSLQTTIAAYQDFATGFTQNDAAALAKGRSELTAETQDLAIWVHGVPSL